MLGSGTPKVFRYSTALGRTFCVLAGKMSEATPLPSPKEELKPKSRTASRLPLFVNVKLEVKKDPLAPEEEMMMGTKRTVEISLAFA